MTVAPPPALKPETTQTAANTPEPWGWNTKQRIGLGVLLLLLLTFLLIQWVRRPARLDDHAVVIDGAAVTLPQRLDPNRATQQELARIPHLGETLAKKIIDYRDARLSTAPDGVVFHQPADLDAIPGVGKKLIDQLAPFLTFPDDAPPP